MYILTQHNIICLLLHTHGSQWPGSNFFSNLILFKLTVTLHYKFLLPVWTTYNKNKLKLNAKHLPLFLYIIIIPLLQPNFKFPCFPNTSIFYVISRSNSGLMLDNLPETKDVKPINSYKCCGIKFYKQTAKHLYFTYSIFPLAHAQTIQFAAYLCTLFACSQHCRAFIKFAQSIHPYT
jgi:hypothetical protein